MRGDWLERARKDGGPRSTRILAGAIVLCLASGLACQERELREDAGGSGVTAQTQPSTSDSRFLRNLPGGLRLPDVDDEVGRRVLADYGAVFVARGGVTPPSYLIFPNEQAVARWQSSVETKRATIAGFTVELQAPAADALLAARDEALRQGLGISPRGSDAARRSYADTVHLWASRVNPGLEHWVSLGRLTKEEGKRIRALTPREQVPEILRLEKRELFFSKDFSKSILYSVAAPGTSQHISMLALDVKEHASPPVRMILARHGWLQTVLSDLPHFTYMGVGEEDLTLLGLKRVEDQGRVFWIPDLSGTPYDR